ncbi:hypothetical protein [Asticcacaulis endophyticus]|uniref:Uncharacterized protein n=1 Tax=Asticcacaulis endophyticus TaxID=1395890 RepID=A0A918UUK4_9CAUL|nr:hypothetical protein [Asticcacaulis endophyticus]GGZ34150.1 hypothetical protein GCM10011273_20660 [Asticcacaulis endophyticus]
MSVKVAAVILAAFSVMAGATFAEPVTVTVPGTSMPWSLKANKNIPFGRNDGTKPIEVKGGDIVAGKEITITATGGTSTIPGGPTFGPAGQESFIATDQVGGSGSIFPARFIDPAMYPVHLNELIGVFVDDKGALVARPFAVGEAFQVIVPPNAKKLQFGLNDDIFADNAGELTVVVTAVAAQ